LSYGEGVQAGLQGFILMKGVFEEVDVFFFVNVRIPAGFHLCF